NIFLCGIIIILIQGDMLMKILYNFFNLFDKIRKKIEDEYFFMWSRNFIFFFCFALFYVLFIGYLYIRENGFKDNIETIFMFAFIFLSGLLIYSIHSIIISIIISFAFFGFYSYIGSFTIINISANGFNFGHLFFIIIFILLSLVWIYYSLLCDNRMSKLLNEFFCCLSTICFTTITYIVSVLSPIVAEKILIAYANKNTLELINKLEYQPKDVLQCFAVLFFPIINICALMILIFSIREYCITKYLETQTNKNII
ncbi:MAG: hypothetical protein RR073_05965, partial [Clostridia bacterium]